MLIGALLLALVAAMALFVVEHDIAQAQESEVATLNSLIVQSGPSAAEAAAALALMPGFTADSDPASGGYVVYVAASVEDLTVRAGATHTAASVAITADTDADDDTDTASPQNMIDLVDDDTKIDVKVTAQDGFTSETYTINVMKVEDASIIATLSSLSLTAGGDNLITGFMPNNDTDTEGGTDGVHDTLHSVRVSAATSSVVVNATTSHTGATVKTSSGTRTGDGVNDRFTLKAAGMYTEIKVEVTAQDKATTLAYMITVTRASSTASKDTTLRQLQLTNFDSDSDGARDPVELTPSFVANSGPASGGYSASIGSGTDENVVLTASSSHAGATVAVTDEDDEPVAEPEAGADGEFVSGVEDIDADGKTFKVKVTAEDGVASATYEITVSKDAPDPIATTITLKKLSVMVGSTELISNFAPETLSYPGNVAARTSSVRVDAVASNSRADVEVTTDSTGTVTGSGPYTAPLAVAGQNTVITVTVESADESDSRDYIITITRAENSDSTQATLNSLIVQSGPSAAEAAAALALMPGFTADSDPASGGYVVYVAASVEDLTVRAGATHTAASVAITADTDADDDTDTASPQNMIDLVDDDTKIDVKVTAQDGFTSETYTINVMKVEDASIIATLSSLSLTAGGDNLITGFMPNNDTDTEGGTDGVHDTLHSVRVSAATSSVVVNATTSHTGATVKTSSGTRTGDGVNDRFTLKAAGMYTEIKVEVTAQDKATTLAYMITVTRASSTASKDTTLRQLQLTNFDSDSDGARDPVELTPSFVANSGPASGGYSASIGSGTDENVVLTASSSHAGATVAVTDEDDEPVAEPEAGADGEFVSGVEDIDADGKTFKVKVTAEDGVASATYEITVSKETAPDSSDLSSLTLDGIDLTPAFDSGIIAYIATVSADTATAEVMVTTAHSKADVVIKKVVGEEDDTAVGAMESNDMEHGKGFGSVSAMVPLSIGINTITIQVNAAAVSLDTANPNETVYRVRVRRSGSESDNATLSALSLGDDIGMSPTFAGTRTQYTAEAPTGTTQVTVMATASHDNAEVDIMPADNDTEMEGHQVAISGDGTANIIVEVTAEDGTTTETYTVTVTVLAANALLTKYDTNTNGRIDKPEVLVAIQNYIVHRTIDKLEVLRVISLYLI